LWDSVNKASLSKLKGVEARAVTPDDSPVLAFILMDTAAAAKLGKVVSQSLKNIHMVVNGTGLSTPEIVSQAMSLLRAEAPSKWMSSWPTAPEAPPIYLQGLAKRIAALKSDWLNRVQNPGLIFSHPVSLSDFLRPDVFLNALRQQSARALKVPIDSLHLVASFEPQLLADPSTSPLPVTVQDLILEGCSFDPSKKVLVESQRNAPLSSVLPPLTIAWMSRAAHPDRAVSTVSAARQTVAMPIYVSLSRENLVGEVYLHTESNRQRILNSAALFLTEND
jgi:dynein heavy chain 2